ncbi:MAG: rplD [Nitrospirae bacterium]|jgi:large subunit ribosomal protein L4|nr:rplD [Nitrospirota bacterium]
MPEIEIKDRDNKIIEKIQLPEDVFGSQAKRGVLHQVVVNFLANQRQGTHSTKTKGLISGGGKKPYKQKHTGRARAGSSRSPLWRGGGTVFGPQPRDYSYKVPKKVKRRALMAALHEKLYSNAIVVIDSIPIEKPRTKEMLSILKNLGLDKKSVLIVLPEYNDSVALSVRNIPGVSITKAMDLNTYDVIASNMLLVTRETLIGLEGIKES